ncbi:transposase (fragment) [Mesorhizobium plurifarium]|uniref:Transposase n=1 Tax=Mesorhizobium plurifarium TaxID=69974 RepID=A0A090FBV4_MESPL
MRAPAGNDPLTVELMDAMVSGRAALWKQCCRLFDVVKIVVRNDVCQRFLAIPGVGPVTALSFTTAIDDPSRFRRSRDVAAYFGLMSRRRQSDSTIDVQGRISKAGDADVRRALYEAASGLMTRFKCADKVKSWGQPIAKRSCHRKPYVAMASKLGGDYARAPERRHVLCRRSRGQPGGRGRRAHDKARKLLGAHR